MSKLTKLLASIASAVLVVTGLTVMPAQAVGSPYAITAVATYSGRTMELVAGNNRVFYKVGGKLFTSDGTTQTELHDFTASTSFSLNQSNPQLPPNAGSIAFNGNNTYINHSVLVGSKLYFWGFDTSWNIWVTDGTVGGTRSIGTPTNPVIGSPSDEILPNIYAISDKLFFWAGWKGASGSSTAQLYRVDTSQVAPVATQATTTSFNSTCYDDTWIDSTTLQQSFGTVGGKLVFDYSQTEGGVCVDKVGALDPAGSSAGTANAVRLGQPSTHANVTSRFAGPQQFTLFNGKLYYFALTGTNYLSELWATDGTDAGTTSVFGINNTTNFQGVGLRNNVYMRPTVAGNYLYFSGVDNASSYVVLYRTNGTTTEVWGAGATYASLGSFTNVPGLVLGAGSSSKLITSALLNGETQDAEMSAIDLTSKTANQLNETASAWKSGLGCSYYCQNYPDLTGLMEPISWDGKAWWVSGTGDDGDGGPAYARELFYSDGTPSGTLKITDNLTSFGNGTANFTIGWQGSDPNVGTVYGQAPNAQWASKPTVIANDRIFYISATGQNSTSWTLNTITRTATPPPPTPPLVCAGQLSKLKVEVSNGSELTPNFNGNTCEYTIKVDSKVTKVEVTPTVGVPSNGVIKVNNATVKSTKTHPVTLNSNIQQIVVKVGASTTYLINVERSAAAAPGDRDSLFSAPSLPGGSVNSVEKDEKKEVNQNGEKKNEEVTYVGGSFNGKVAKLDDHGKKDDDFASKVPDINGTVTTVKVDKQHRILVGGDFEDEDGDKDIIRLKPNGEKDKSFDAPTLGGNNARVSDIEVQKDGKVIVVGEFDDNTKSNCKRLHEDGHEDNDFESHLPNINGEVKTAKVQDDGKILLGGHFDDVSDGDHDKIVRLEKNGDHDRDFKPSVYGAHFNDDVEDIETQKDGKVIVVGKSQKSNDDEADKVSRLHKDGREDDSFVFDGNIPVGKKVEAVKVKDSGEVYIAGDFDDLGDSDGDKVAKVKSDGHVDTGWNPPHQGGDVHDLELEKHGKVFLGGEGSGDGDRCDKVHEDGDRNGDKPRYDSIDDDRASNKVDTGSKGQTKIHGDGFKDGTTVTIGGKSAKVVKIDERDEELTVQIPAPDNDHKGGSDHQRKPADIVITVPNGTSIPDVIEVKEGFGYTDVKAPQVITPNNGNHVNPDKDDSDGKGKVRDDESLSAHIPSDDDVTHVSKTPTVCTVDDDNRVHYHHRGDCKIVTDAPGDMGHVDPAPITEVTPVLGLEPLLVIPALPDFTDPNNGAPDTGLQLPTPTVEVPEIPVTYTSLTPDVCDVTTEGLVVPIDITSACQVSVATPGTPIYEPEVEAPITIPAIAWIPPVPAEGVITDPGQSLTIPGTGGSTRIGDVAFTYNKAKGTLTPGAWGIYFGPIQATISYTYTRGGVTSAPATCVVKWGVLKKWTKLSKADQKKFKKPLAQKSFTTTSSCKVNAATKAALALPGTVFTATSAVLRTRMWPSTYLPKKPNNEPIAKRLRTYTLTISTQ